MAANAKAFPESHDARSTTLMQTMHSLTMGDVQDVVHQLEEDPRLAGRTAARIVTTAVRQVTAPSRPRDEAEDQARLAYVVGLATVALVQMASPGFTAADVRLLTDIADGFSTVLHYEQLDELRSRLREAARLSRTTTTSLPTFEERRAAALTIRTVARAAGVKLTDDALDRLFAIEAGAEENRHAGR